MQANDEFLRLVFENIWPWWTYAWVLVFFSLLCVFTFSGHAEKSGDKSTLRFIIEAARKKLLVAWILCTLLFFLFVYIIAWKHFGEDSHKASLLYGVIV
ncbi:Uncharacterised protein [Escherichia coli]|nr:Uncharacterised protein [Escherichia coli]